MNGTIQTSSPRWSFICYFNESKCTMIYYAEVKSKRIWQTAAHSFQWNQISSSSQERLLSKKANVYIPKSYSQLQLRNRRDRTIQTHPLLPYILTFNNRFPTSSRMERVEEHNSKELSFKQWYKNDSVELQIILMTSLILRAWYTPPREDKRTWFFQGVQELFWHSQLYIPMNQWRRISLLSNASQLHLQ